MAKKTKAPKGQEKAQPQTEDWDGSPETEPQWVNPNEDKNPLANSPQPDEELGVGQPMAPETPDTELPAEGEPVPKTNTDEYE